VGSSTSHKSIRFYGLLQELLHFFGTYLQNAVFWDVTPHGFCKSRRFGGTHRLHHQDGKNRLFKNNVSSNNACVVLVTNDVSEENVTSIVRVERISELGTTLAVTLFVTNVFPRFLILFILMMGAISSCDKSVLTRATRCHFPGGDILHSHGRKGLRSYIEQTCSYLDLD
jgi:hypothetical protein